MADSIMFLFLCGVLYMMECSLRNVRPFFI